MINYKDLMIGNWVYESERSKFPMRVVNVGEDYCYLDFEGNEGDVFEVKDKDMMPIEVTEGLLEKAKFKKCREQNHGDYYEGHKQTFNKAIVWIFRNPNKTDKEWQCLAVDKDYNVEGGIKFDFLHELQNGIRLITKSDLEIKEL